MKKDLWEGILRYPSFNNRFWFTVGIVLSLFLGFLYYILYEANLPLTLEEKLETSNLVVQILTLLLGILAAFFALRQLVETRFTELDSVAMNELKNHRYSRAAAKWKEAFYIKSESSVLVNLCESLLLLEDYDNFDEYIHLSETDSFKKKFLLENSDRIVLLYLKAMRHLLVKNQGQAEKYLGELVDLNEENPDTILGWTFMDMRTSRVFQNLEGECKLIAENTIGYLEKKLPAAKRNEFENGTFATPPETGATV